MQSETTIALTLAAPKIGKPQPRTENLVLPSPPYATPSPLNGERAGVRGVTNPSHG